MSGWRWCQQRQRAGFAGCLRAAGGTARVRAVMDTTERLVIVPAGSLDDLLELARLAADRLGEDPLARSLKGSAAELRFRQVSEP